MQLQRFTFKEFDGNLAAIVGGGGKLFELSHKPKEEPLLPPPEPTFSAAELKAARHEGYQQGFLDGIKDGRGQVDAEQADINVKLTEAVEKIAGSVAPLLKDYREMAVQLQQELPPLALAIARKIAGDLVNENAANMVQAVALRWVETMIHEPKLTITVNDRIGDTLEKQLEALENRLQSTGNILVVRDPNMSATDCRIDWKHGTMTHSTDQMWQQVEKVMESMAQTAKRDTLEHMDKLEAELIVAPVQVAPEVKEV